MRTRRVLASLLFSLMATAGFSQSVADSQAAYYEVERLIKANQLVVTSLDFNAAGYPFDGVAPQLRFYQDPATGNLRKITSHQVVSLISEDLEITNDPIEVRAFVDFKRTQTKVGTLSNGKAEVSQRLLTELRIYLSANKILKVLESATGEDGKIQTTEVPKESVGELAAILASADGKVELFRKLMVFAKE